jgi:hypothetical protein
VAPLLVEPLVVLEVVDELALELDPQPAKPTTSVAAVASSHVEARGTREAR